MAIKTLEERKKQQKLMIILIVVVLATLLVLYFGILKKGSTISVTNESEDTQAVKTQGTTLVVEEKLKKINLNTDFLVNTILVSLKIHGLIPVEKGVTGRINPFVAQ